MSTDVSHVHINRKEYWVIFALLFILTIAEVLVVEVPGISKELLLSALVLMALAKAALVGLFYMHLGHETSILKNSIIISLMIPFFYAAVLVAEAMWRYLS